MKHILASLTLALSFLVVNATTSFAATEKEKTFVDSYKKAFESKDQATLESFLYKKGADPMVLGFYTMMLTGDMGGKISSIELLDLTPEDVKRATEPHPLPSGDMAALPVTPTKKLVLKIETSDANGTSSSSSETFVAEVDGKFMIPVPGPIKK